MHKHTPAIPHTAPPRVSARLRPRPVHEESCGQYGAVVRCGDNLQRGRHALFRGEAATGTSPRPCRGMYSPDPIYFYGIWAGVIREQLSGNVALTWTHRRRITSAVEGGPAEQW